MHFVSSFGGLKEAAAEGVSVVHLLQSQWGSLFTNIEDFLGRPVISDDGKTVLFTSQENRQHFLGHLSLLGLKQPVMPWCTAGPSEAEMGAGLEATLSDWADRCHTQGGTVVIPHFPLPDGEPATLIASGRADAVESLAVRQDLAYVPGGNAGRPWNTWLGFIRDPSPRDRFSQNACHPGRTDHATEGCPAAAIGQLTDCLAGRAAPQGRDGAVGCTDCGGSAPKTLIERWNGSAWK